MLEVVSTNAAPNPIGPYSQAIKANGFLQRSLEIINTNLPLLDRFFEKWAGRVSWIRPKAGAIGFPRLLGAQSVEDVAAQLVKSHGVLLLPASVYDHPGNHFRVGFGRYNFPEALARFDDFLAMHPPA